MTIAAGKRTFSVFVHDKPGVLNRVASLFRRRNYNIHSLNVGTTHEPGISRMTVVCVADETTAKHIEANLYKLVDVLWITDVTYKLMLSRTLALIKVKCTRDTRDEILSICNVFRARPVDMTTNRMTIELTGTQDKIDGLITILKPFGILEMVQTGTIAMTRSVVDQDMSHLSLSRLPNSTV